MATKPKYDMANSKQRSDFKRLTLDIAKKLEEIELEEFINLYDLKPQPQRKKHEVMTVLEEQGKLRMTEDSVENMVKNLEVIGRQDLKEKAEEFQSKYYRGGSDHHRPARRVYSHPESDNDQPDYGASPVQSTASRETTPASEQTELVYSTNKGYSHERNMYTLF